MIDQASNLSDVVALAREMVRIPSLSGQEGDLAALLSHRMAEAGFTSVTTDRNGSVLGLIGPEDADVALQRAINAARARADELG